MSLDAWQRHVASFRTPSTAKATRQLVDSVGVYLGLWVLLAFAVQISWWLAVPIALLAGGVLVRVFIIHHDCGHGSFLNSAAGNRFWGVISGVLTFTPFEQWRSCHAVHHGTTGNLDRRGTGDVWTLTVKEYEQMSWWGRCGYRLSRNLFVLLGVAPLFMFVVQHRFSKRDANKRERRSVLWTNVAVGLWAVLGCLVFGIIPYLILQGVVFAVAGAVGVWLFFTQHQFEGAYWERKEDWSYLDAALRGSAFLKLPRVLQWFTGNIGFHHIHHLDARIPNYRLQACHESHAGFDQIVPKLKTFNSLRGFGLKLWDEKEGHMVKFPRAKRRSA
ncbi:MAG: fatty acid desaturase [Planctomycetota bacterium]